MYLLQRGLMVTLFLLIVWQCLVTLFKLPSYILPTPLQIITSLIQHAQLISHELIPTLIEIVLGLFFGILLGILLAMSICVSRTLHTLLLPLLLISQALPLFAIAPLLVIWFGYGITVKILTTTLMLFFPITNNFLDGLKATPQHYLDMAQLMNSSRWQILYQIRFPAALANLASGIRIATAMAPLGAILSEWVGSSKGLGFLLLNANAQMQIDLMFAVLLVVILLSSSIYFLIDKLVYLATPWLFLKK